MRRAQFGRWAHEVRPPGRICVLHVRVAKLAAPALRAQGCGTGKSDVIAGQLRSCDLKAWRDPGVGTYGRMRIRGAASAAGARPRCTRRNADTRLAARTPLQPTTRD